MLNQEQLKKATLWELQNQLELIQHDIDNTKTHLQKLEKNKSVISIALRQKNGGAHEFKGLTRGQGYI